MTEAKLGKITISYGDLTTLLSAIFVRAGVSAPNAAILAENCAACERDGSLSHGVFRIPGYVASLKSGWVDGAAVPTVQDAGAAFIRIDARNGFAQPALALAMPLIMERVSIAGAVVVAIRDSHHFSALWPDIEPLARQGLVALSMVSGLACVVPPGGRTPVMGTNPIAFATPVEGSDPLVFDFATSSMSNGDLRIAAREGHPVPLGTGIDAQGNLTDQPSEILRGGALLPFGGHKGAAMSLMVEVLASSLTGGQFSYEVDFANHPGAETPKTGQVLVIIDPRRGGNNTFSGRVGDLLHAMRNSGQARLPSDRRYRNRFVSNRDGISIPEKTYDALAALIN